MPAEPTQAKLKRRTSRRDNEDYKFDVTHARELETKRSRGEVSCAECRRLKIKCDKQVPCQSCQRRGCAALCPNGSLATGQGTRFVLAATEHLHRKISRLSDRIRLLEDALASVHGKTSNGIHPLLSEDLIISDDTLVEETEMLDDVLGATAAVGHAPDVIDAFGTLSISDHGISRFFGPTGGSESLLLANLTPKDTSKPTSPDSSGRNSLSPVSNPGSINDLALFSQSFPFTPLGRTDDVQVLIESHLPSFERAHSLCLTYFTQTGWLFRGVTREQLLDDMLSTIYRKPHPNPSPDQINSANDYGGPHSLALLFIIFAVGALVETSMPDEHHSKPVSAEALAEHYRQVSRAALSLQPVLEKPSMVTIQTLHLMSIYNALSGGDLETETSMEMTWSLITLAAHLSQTIGLHRDSERWGLTAQMVQRRRILFWDLFVADVWQSLNTGRPPSFSLAYIDCGLPQYEDQNDNGAAFEIWQFRFAAECVADVTARTLTAEAPTYAVIMDLDRKVRNFALPEGHTDKNDMAASFRICVLEHIRETVLMYIHRSFFAQAIIEHPVNPLKSPYAHSFLASYRAAATILKSIGEQFEMWPNSCARFWTMWTFAFSAAVVFGTVVTRGPKSPLAKEAMKELERACLLFSKASEYSKRATKALPILMKLREKAHYALAAAGDAGGTQWTIKQEEDGNDELSIIAGHTRFVSLTKGSQTHPSLASMIQPMAYENGPAPPVAQFHNSFAPDPVVPVPSHPGPWPNSSHPPQEDYVVPRVRDERGQLQYSYSYDKNRAGSDERYDWPPREPYSHHQPPTSQTYHNATRAQSYHHLQPQQHPPSGGYSAVSLMPQHNMYQSYPAVPPSHPRQVHPHNAQLADLGLAARDSRLDERWSTFMQDSGLLDDGNFHRT